MLQLFVSLCVCHVKQYFGTAIPSGKLEMVCVYCGSRQALDLVLSPGWWLNL